MLIAACCAVLCCAVLCCAALCCAVLCCPVLCCAVLCRDVLCCAMLCLGYMLDDNMHSYIYKKAHNTSNCGRPGNKPSVCWLCSDGCCYASFSKKMGKSSHLAFFQISSFFFQENRKAGNISKVWKFNRRKNLWNA